MAKTPEGAVKDMIKRKLREAGIYYHMPVQNGMGMPTLDFICCAGGRYLAIEAKAPGQKPTERQRITMMQIRESGGLVFVVDSEVLMDDALLHLRALKILDS